MIETVEGLNNVEAISAVEGVDVLHVGSNDLLVNMGKPGEFEDPAIVAAQDRVIAAAKAHGKFAGIGGNRDVGRQIEAVRRGAPVCHHADGYCLSGRCRPGMDAGYQGGIALSCSLHVRDASDGITSVRSTQ